MKRYTLAGRLGETVIGLLLAVGSPRHIDLLANQILARNQFIKSKLRDSLAAIKSYDGVLGRIEFDEKRDPRVAGAVIKVQNGKHVIAK